MGFSELTDLDCVAPQADFKGEELRTIGGPLEGCTGQTVHFDDTTALIRLQKGMYARVLKTLVAANEPP